MNPIKDNAVVPVIRGDRYRQTHKASVIGILGSKAPKVSSRGSRFYNRDRWTVRFMTQEMCDWARANPGCIPTRSDIQKWVAASNSQRVYDPEIVIANTPDKLPLRMAMALTGGAYHEAWHTYYSELQDLEVDPVAQFIPPRWALVKDWSRYQEALLDWSNIIEDIRIERRGREDFEATFVKMCDLQDFILDMEEKGQQGVRSHGGKPGALSVIAGVFRDVGLGYNTEKQRAAMERYRKDNLKAVELVLQGPIAGMLREAIDLGKKDKVGCLRIAMEVIAKLAELGQQSQESPDQAKNGKPGDGKHKCPSCGAPADKLIVRPKSDGAGGKVKGIGIVTCTACGYQAEVPVETKTPQPKPDKSKNGGEKEKGPKFVGFDNPDPLVEDPAGDPEKPDGKEGEGKSGGGTDPEEKGCEKGEGASGEKTPEAGKPEPGDSGKGSKPDDKDDGGKGKDKTDSKGQGNKGDKGKADSKGDVPGDSSTGEGDADSGGHGAGGYKYQELADGDDDWSQVADDALEQAESGKGLGLKDSNGAFEEALGGITDKEDQDLEKNEAPWRPYDPSLDEATLVFPSKQGKEHDTAQAQELLKTVRREIAFLRARLRTIIRALEMTSVDHGVPKGKNLSSQYLVDTRTALLSGDLPMRAYDQPGVQIDMSFAAVVVVDESGSMSSVRKDVTRIFCAVTEPFDGLGCATMAMGFRDGRNGPRNLDPKDTGTYHRTEGIQYDIFKNWNERFSAVKWRFANTIACGGTPMADGIQFALDAISRRNEANRVIFVVTDGCPNYGHEPIIKRQIRLAREAGIHIIGVGLGGGSSQVIKLFDESIHAPKVMDIPKLLVDKLNRIVDSNGLKRGMRVKKTS